MDILTDYITQVFSGKELKCGGGVMTPGYALGIPTSTLTLTPTLTHVLTHTLTHTLTLTLTFTFTFKLTITLTHYPYI